MSRGDDIKQLCKELKKLGCEITVTGSGHWRVTRPGHPGAVTMSHSPNNGRAVRNARADVRRYLQLPV